MYLVFIIMFLFFLFHTFSSILPAAVIPLLRPFILQNIIYILRLPEGLRCVWVFYPVKTGFFSYYVCECREPTRRRRPAVKPSVVCSPKNSCTQCFQLFFLLLFSLTYIHTVIIFSLENFRMHTHTHTQIHCIKCVYMHRPTISVVKATGVYRIACNVSESPWTCRFYVIFFCCNFSLAIFAIASSCLLAVVVCARITPLFWHVY